MDPGGAAAVRPPRTRRRHRAGLPADRTARPGQETFAGETVTDIIAALVSREPDWTALPAATPASSRRLLARCLEKDPKRRVRDIGDVRFEIEQTIARGSGDARSAELVSGAAPCSLASAARVQSFAVNRNRRPSGRKLGQAISASADGTLAVRPPPATVLVFPDSNAFDAEPHLVDRSGVGSRVGTTRPFSLQMAVNPVDSRALAAAILDARAGTQDLWLIDLTNDSLVPLTTTRGLAGNPVWSADGKRLAYAYQPPGDVDDVYIREIGTGSIQPLIETPGIPEHPVAWSHDDRSLLVFASDDQGAYLSSWSFASRTSTRFAGPRALENAAFSPRDDFVAFTSQESGRPEVYVTTFPDRRRTWPLTTEGGRLLSWRHDGREILVATLSGHIAAYPVSIDGSFSHGAPTTLVRGVGSAAAYSSPTRDHSRILIRVSPDAAKDKGEIRLLIGWQDALREGRN